MNDEELLQRIHDLVAEEHALEAGPAHALTDDQRDRQRALEISLDQCWDLLRQRRAKRQYGNDADDAVVRPADVVEHYRQ
jgi:Protein of unknown function (DUF2630)